MVKTDNVKYGNAVDIGKNKIQECCLAAAERSGKVRVNMT